MAVELAVKWVNQTFTNYGRAFWFLAICIIIHIILAIVFAVLAIAKKDISLAFVEIYILPALGCLLKQFASVIRDNSVILDKANNTLKEINNQDEIAQRIREEKESERQRREIK